MRNRLTLLLLAITLLPSGTFANEKGKVVWMTFNEGVAEARKTGKKVMIDVYTDWCGWCKKMDKDTYDEATVTEYLNRKYVAIRLNAESATPLQYQGRSYTERELAAAFNVTGYPSVIFLRHDGEPITVYPGYADARNFKVVLSYIAEDHYKATTFQDYVNTTK